MSQARATAQMGTSRSTAAEWWCRWQAHGEAGLEDQSSRPRRSLRHTDSRTAERVYRLRRQNWWGPVRVDARLGLPAFTAPRILVRSGLNQLSHVDRSTGRVIRRYKCPHPCGLVQLDAKKVAKVPPGAGVGPTGRPTRCHEELGGGPGWAQAMCTSPLTTAPAWPTSCPSDDDDLNGWPLG